MYQPSTRRPSVVNLRKPLFARAQDRAAARSPIQRAKPFVDAVALAQNALQAAEAARGSSEKAAKSAIKSGLRFMQFLRAYMKAFAAGFGSFLLLTELAIGHFNILSMIGMHLFSIVAAPFYALMLAPAIFGMFRGLAATGLQPAHRAYVVGMSIGMLMLVLRIFSGKFILGGEFDADMFAIATTIAGGIAAYTFNRAVENIEVGHEVAANA